MNTPINAPMKAAEIEKFMALTGWSREHLRLALGVGDRTLRRWLRNGAKSNIPGPVRQLIRAWTKMFAAGIDLPGQVALWPKFGEAAREAHKEHLTNHGCAP